MKYVCRECIEPCTLISPDYIPKYCHCMKMEADWQIEEDTDEEN